MQKTLELTTETVISVVRADDGNHSVFESFQMFFISSVHYSL